MADYPVRAIVFADIGESTKLYDTLGDARARRIIADCLEWMSDSVARHGGRVVKTIGDEVLAVFDRPDPAVDASTDILSGVQRVAEQHGIGLTAHAGVQVGPVIEEGGDVFGDTVNVACRLVGLAKSDEVLTTAEVVDELGPALRASARPIDWIAVAGKRERLQVYSVGHDGMDTGEMTMASTMSGAWSASSPSRLILRHEGQVFQVSEESPTLTLGRDPTSGLVLASRWASRNHARIRLKEGRFVLSDQSTNGTWVAPEQGALVRVHREELSLPFAGKIGAYQSSEETSPDLPVSFLQES